MSGIAEKLRRAASHEDGGPGVCRVLVSEALGAADEIDRLQAIVAWHRWSIDEDGDDLLICDALHEKDEKCEYVRYVRASKLDRLTAAAATAREENRRLRVALANMANNFNTAGSPYDKAMTALEEMMRSIKAQVREALIPPPPSDAAREEEKG